MIKDSVDELYSLTQKLMPLLSDEIEMLGGLDGQSAIEAKGRITDTLARLAQLLTHLAKLSKEDQESYDDTSPGDQAIIDEFLKRVG
jgi:hypothetical protein